VERADLAPPRRRLGELAVLLRESAPDAGVVLGERAEHRAGSGSIVTLRDSTRHGPAPAGITERSPEMARTDYYDDPTAPAHAWSNP